MDELARLRQTQGLPGVSVQWPVLDSSVVHTNRTGSPPLGDPCKGLATEAVTVAPPVADAEVTAAAKRALGAYPKPYDA